MATIKGSDFVTRQPGKLAYVATQRLYLNRDRSKVVPEGSPEAAFLLCSPGKPLDAETVKRYGLLAAPEPAVESEPEPETKMAEGPPEDKAVRTRRTNSKPADDEHPLARHPFPSDDDEEEDQA